MHLKGPIKLADNTNYVGVVTFTPLSLPLAMAGSAYSGAEVRLETDEDGNFPQDEGGDATFQLATGYYRVRYGGLDFLTIAAPTGDAEIEIGLLVVDPAEIAGGAGSGQAPLPEEGEGINRNLAGTVEPEGAVLGAVGWTYLKYNAPIRFYSKTSGTEVAYPAGLTNTGWIELVGEG